MNYCCLYFVKEILLHPAPCQVVKGWECGNNIFKLTIITPLHLKVDNVQLSIIKPYCFTSFLCFIGICADIAVSKHEYWSSLAPLPFEVVVSAGQKAKEDFSEKG